MPFSSASRVLLNPRFSQPLAVIRRAQVVNDSGRNVMTETTIIPAPMGVITQGSIEEVVQDEAAQYARRTITVHAYRFRLRDAATGFSPDIVVFQGDRYMVRRLYDWSNVAPGFSAADCELMTPEATPDGV